MRAAAARRKCRLPELRNPRHERFVQELVKGRLTQEAYVLAGYKEHHGHSYRLRSRPAIESRYNELIGAAARESEVTAAKVMRELAAIAFANIADFITIDADGQPRPDFTRLTHDKMAALVEMSVEGEKTRRVRFKLGDKRAALVDLAKMLGLFREHTEAPAASEPEKEPMSDFEVARRIAFILTKASVELDTSGR